MKKSSFCVFLSVIILVAGISGMVPLHAEISMDDGNWEVVTQMIMEGMPFQIPATKITQCLTKQNAVPGSDKGENCKVLSQSITGNKVTWKVRCVDKEGTTEGEGEITYSGSSYKGALAMRMIEKSGNTRNFQMNLSGRRIGDCTDKSKKTISVGGKEIQQMDSAQIERMRAEAERGLAEAERNQKEQKARWEEMARLSVPAEDPGSCGLRGENFQDPECESKVGKLNLNAGEWEITTQEGIDQAGYPVVGEPKRTTQCLTPESPMITALGRSSERKAARSSEKITWSFSKIDPFKLEERGGVIYKGDTLEGVVLRTEEYGGGGKIVRKTKISGHRIGDGACLAKGRDYTSQGRDYTSKKRGVGELPNPVKELRKLFRF